MPDANTSTPSTRGPDVKIKRAMDESKLQTNWLANNAVVAFFGALLIAQTPQSPDGTTELILGFSVPSIPAWWINSAIALLLAIAAIMVLAAHVPHLRRLALQYATPLIPILGLLTWAAFTTGFAQTLQHLPDHQWWSQPFVYVGLAFAVYLLMRFVIDFANLIRDGNPRNTEPN